MSFESRNRLMEEARQSLAEGQRALEELAAQAKPTEARSAELNTLYVRAMEAAKSKKKLADDDLSMETLGTELREHDGKPVEQTSGSPTDARTIDGRIFVPWQSGAIVPSNDYERNFFAEFRGAEAEVMRAIPEWPVESRNAYLHYLHKKRGNEESLSNVEVRALTPYLDPEGGYVISREMRAELIRQERNLVQIRRYARVLRTNASSVSFPSFKLTVSLQKIRALQQENIADIRDILGKTTFTPNEFARIIQVPEQLVEDATFPIISYLAEEMALQSSEDEEGLFLLGSGKNEPYGVLTAPIIDTPIAGSAVNVVPEDIKGLPYQLRVPFRRNATWMFNRAGIALISKFRDNIGGAGTGQFLWQMGLQAGQPDTLCGYPVMESEFFPNAFSGSAAIAGTPVCLFGDWRQYWIVDRLNLTLRRLDELYAATAEIGFRYRKRFDAAPVRLEAFTKLTRK